MDADILRDEACILLEAVLVGGCPESKDKVLEIARSEHIRMTHFKTWGDGDIDHVLYTLEDMLDDGDIMHGFYGAYYADENGTVRSI